MKKTYKDYFYVCVQFILFGCYLYNFELSHNSTNGFFKTLCSLLTVTGLSMILNALLQINKNISPFPTPKSGGKLIQNGIFKYIRHPIYSGILFSSFGYALYSNSLSRLIIFGLLGLLFYYKSKYEEEKLTAVFPEY